MDPQPIEDAQEAQNQAIAGLMDNQLALAAQVHVMQAALATALLHSPDRSALLATFRQYMSISKQSAPQLAERMAALEGAMTALLGGEAH